MIIVYTYMLYSVDRTLLIVLIVDSDTMSFFLHISPLYTGHRISISAENGYVIIRPQ